MAKERKVGKDGRTQITFRANPQRAEKLRDIAHKNATTFQDMAEQGLALLLKEPLPHSYLLPRFGADINASSPSPSPEPSAKHNEVLGLLEFILMHGTQDDKLWIVGNLRNFCEAIRSRSSLDVEVSRLTETVRAANRAATGQKHKAK